ncbi:hypothetical protein [Roseateles sp. L2-2]|uniref:hypothetical protein n=1 Tax=Roseateles TaxID=93681 RepID=UPI003D364FB3
MQASVTPPRKTELAREMLAPGQRRLPPALRALLITVDGKRNAEELRQLGRGLGLGDDGLTRLVDQGLVEVPVIVVPPPAAAKRPAAPAAPTSTAAPAVPAVPAVPIVTGLDVIDEAEVREAAALARAAQDRARRLVSAKFFGLDLVTRMLAGREGELRDLARQADTESRFLEWVDLCCERIEAESDAERATKFRDSVAQTLTAG